jgi:hypothetical protein
MCTLRLRLATLSAAVLLPVAACAGWTGFPMRDSATNYPTWEQLVQAYDPISQLWYAACERYEVSGARSAGYARTFEETIPATMGTVLEEVDYITATRTNTVTNHVIFVTNFVRTVGMEYANTRDIGPMTYTDADGTQRVARPFVVPDVVEWIDAQHVYNWDIDVPAGKHLPITYYVGATAASSNSFDDYLAQQATNESGEIYFPDGPPMETLGGIFERQSIGRMFVALSTNTWGYAYLDHRAAPSPFFSTWLDGRNEKHLLGSAGWNIPTGAWEYRRNASLIVAPDQNLTLGHPYGSTLEAFGEIVEFSQPPKLVKYLSTTNDIPTGSAEIYGWALLTNIVTTATAARRAQGLLTNTSETASATTNGTALTLQWVYVTNVIPATLYETGVTYAVLYDAPVTRLHHREISPADLLLAMDEQQQYLSEMKWTTQPAALSNVTGSTQGLYSWTGWGWDELDGPVTNSTDPQWPSEYVEYAADATITAGWTNDAAWFSFGPDTRADWNYRVRWTGQIYVEVGTFTTNASEDVVLTWGDLSNVVTVANGRECTNNPYTATLTFGTFTSVVARACDTYTNAITVPDWATVCTQYLVDITIHDVTPWLEASVGSGAFAVGWDTWQTNAQARFEAGTHACGLDFYAAGSPQRAGTNGVTCVFDVDWTNSSSWADSIPPTPYEIPRTNGIWDIDGRYVRLMSAQWPAGWTLPYTGGLLPISPPWSGDSFNSRGWNMGAGAFWILRWPAADGGYWTY